MAIATELFDRLKVFIGFEQADVTNLVSIRPLVERHGPVITDAFYKRIGETPETAKMIEGRVESLKKTHRAWLMGLVGGDYGAAYLESRERIGLAHVRIGLDPYWVEGVMSFIRTETIKALAADLPDAKDAAAKGASFIKACDLDLLIVNLSYNEDRLERLSAFTGMKRQLIENIIKIPKK